MALHHNSLLDKVSLQVSRRGFTLMEIIVVMGFIAIVGSFTMIVSMDSFRSNNFHTERDLLVTTLQHARAQAMGNVCTGALCTTGKPHGVAVQSDKFIIFQGSSYATRDTSEDAVVPANASVSHGGTISEVAFAQLSGNVATPGVITFSADGRTSDITVGTAGQIFWSN